MLSLTGFLAFPAAVSANVVILPSPGFAISWNGNEGDHFNSAQVAPVPANLATAAGAVAFSSSDLGPELGIGYHLKANLNDGLYGNTNSWIGGAFQGAPFAGVSLGGMSLLTGFAFGRDNGNANEVVPGGQLTDRSLGLYTLQVTRVASPDGSTAVTGNPITGWTNAGTLNYVSEDDTIAGGAFTSYFRHEYQLSENGLPVEATGFRILVPSTGLGSGTDIDEIEIMGRAVPEPSVSLCLLAGLGTMAWRRRRQD